MFFSFFDVVIKPETDRLDVGVPRIGAQIRVTIVAGVFQRFLYGYGNGIFRGDIVGIVLAFIFFGMNKLDSNQNEGQCK
ncbi:MAG: hypothetical protein RIQ98_1365 [Bacteroidota bacterium]